MVLEYVPQYRDEFEAASARFPGDATQPRAAGSPARVRAIGWLALAIAVLTLVLLLLPRSSSRGPSPFTNALAEADRIDHPVFVAGLVLAAVGGAMVVVPLAYALALRRSARPITSFGVRVDLGYDAITVRTPSSELTLTWPGVVAFAETRHLFVLKTLGVLRLALPKRAADPDALRALLRTRVTPLADVAAVPPPLPPRLAA
jgi:hypothetical protein